MIRKYVKHIYYKYKARSFGRCGRNVIWGKNCSFAGNENIYIGDNVQIGRNSIIWSTVAKVIIKNNVILGPNVSIHSGNHEVHFVGKHIVNINNLEADSSCFGDIVIEEGVWVGDGVKILKGVKIAKGTVIGAGSVVIHDTEPYTIYAGVPCRKIGERFSKEQIMQHELKLSQNS